MALGVRLLLLVWWALAGAAVAQPSVTGYALKSMQPVPGGTGFAVYTYAATLGNPGAPLRSVSGTVRSKHPAVTVVDGSVTFGDVGPGAQVTGLDTFSVRRQQSVPFRAEDLVWTIASTPGAAIWADFTLSVQGGAAPLAVRFTPAALSDTAIVQYRWDFNGDGIADANDAVGREWSFVYNTPGTYSASLTVRDSLGRTDKRTKLIEVTNAPPIVQSATVQPSNGAVPLTVNFSIVATDAQQSIARYEWDFDGDGTYDRTINGALGNVATTYATQGTFDPRVRVTDAAGASTVYTAPTLQVRAGPVNSPRVSLSLSGSQGTAPFTTQLSATVSDPLGQAVRQYEWDLGRGSGYTLTTTTNAAPASYPGAGIFFPKVRVTMTDGRTAEDTERVTVSSTFQFGLSNDTLDPTLGQSTVATTVLSAETAVSIVVERRTGGVIRTLLPMSVRAAGTYRDTWDGRNDAGQAMPEGTYKLVLLYMNNGLVQRYDLSASTGGAQITPARTAVPPRFEPYNGKPLSTDFTLVRAAEVTAFVGSFDVDTRYVTFFSRRPFGKGTHRITWNGDSSTGQLLSPAPGDAFLLGLLAYTLPDNVVYVRNGVQVTAVRTDVPIFDPTAAGMAGQSARCSIQFDLSMPAVADIEIRDASSGAVVRRIEAPRMPAGSNAVAWDGKAFDGRFVAPGTYRVSVTAVQGNGFRSLSGYALQRVFY